MGHWKNMQKVVQNNARRDKGCFTLGEGFILPDLVTTVVNEPCRAPCCRWCGWTISNETASLAYVNLRNLKEEKDVGTTCMFIVLLDGIITGLIDSFESIDRAAPIIEDYKPTHSGWSIATTRRGERMPFGTARHFFVLLPTETMQLLTAMLNIIKLTIQDESKQHGIEICILGRGDKFHRVNHMKRKLKGVHSGTPWTDICSFLKPIPFYQKLVCCGVSFVPNSNQRHASAISGHF